MLLLYFYFALWILFYLILFSIYFSVGLLLVSPGCNPFLCPFCSLSPCYKAAKRNR